MRTSSREARHPDDAPSPIGSTVDEMSEFSFPASDPPAVWTWDVPTPTPSPPDVDPPAAA
jgi:hypothetical protein